MCAGGARRGPVLLSSCSSETCLQPPRKPCGGAGQGQAARGPVSALASAAPKLPRHGAPAAQQTGNHSHHLAQHRPRADHLSRSAATSLPVAFIHRLQQGKNRTATRPFPVAGLGVPLPFPARSIQAAATAALCTSPMGDSGNRSVAGCQGGPTGRRIEGKLKNLFGGG